MVFTNDRSGVASGLIEVFMKRNRKFQTLE